MKFIIPKKHRVYVVIYHPVLFSRPLAILTVIKILFASFVPFAVHNKLFRQPHVHRLPRVQVARRLAGENRLDHEHQLRPIFPVI